MYFTCKQMRVLNALIPNSQIRRRSYVNPLVDKLPKSCFVKKNEFVKQDMVITRHDHPGNIFHKAGPMKHIAFDPNRTTTAIVNAGGLCPGINNVIYDLVYTLERLYNVDQIYGIMNGFTGLGKYNMLELDIDGIEGIQYESGSLLGTSRGIMDPNKMSEMLRNHNIDQLFVIGGDGSHKGAHALSKVTDTSIVCIPKTIDNDLPIIDRSFGYNTAVEKAKESIMSAYYEAKDTENAIGIVKLMGRSCGWIALSACLSSYNVDVCLIPEYGFRISKLKEYVKRIMSEKGFCLMVFAEGVDIVEGMDEGIVTAETRPHSNVDSGVYLKNLFQEDYCVKYIDPTYMIRSVPANTNDCLYCKLLAQSAVHSAMSGYTDCTVGYVNNNLCVIPLDEITRQTNYVSDVMWNRLLLSNLQPNFIR